MINYFLCNNCNKRLTLLAEEWYKLCLDCERMLNKQYENQMGEESNE